MEQIKPNARALARQEQANRENQRKVAHGKVVCLLNGKKTRHVVINSAMKQVSKWKRLQLCSLDYIQAWEGLLKKPSSVAKVLKADTAEARRLRQNTPFAAYLQK